MKYIWPYIWWMIKKLGILFLCFLQIIAYLFMLIWYLDFKEPIKYLETNNLCYENIDNMNDWIFYKTAFHELFGIYKEHTI